MSLPERPSTATLLKWFLVGLVSVTVIPVLAVAVFLPFASRVAVAFQYSADVASPQVTAVRTLDFLFSSLSASTKTFPSGTMTGKVTGGGTIAADGVFLPRSRSFGFVAMGDVVIDSSTGVANCTDATPCPAKGHLNYVNHTTNPQVHINGEVTEITHFEFFPTPPGQRETKGTVTFKGTDTKYNCGTFTVTVSDYGEPGTSDKFGIRCGTESTQDGTNTIERLLSGGNIQIHPPQSQ